MTINVFINVIINFNNIILYNYINYFYIKTNKLN